jgi:hypothetical protein
MERNLDYIFMNDVDNYIQTVEILNTRYVCPCHGLGG